MKTNYKELEKQKVFKDLSDVADRMGKDCYVVGGYVRDLLLGIPSNDIDIVVVGSGIRVAEAYQELVGGELTVYKSYGTAMVKSGEGLEVEFVGARKESYVRGSRNPIVEEGTLQDDLTRRDFTINSMAICLNKSRFGELVDPFGGVQDIENGILRTPTDPGITFGDDPLRILRCIRFATRLNFRIDETTWNGVLSNTGGLDIIVQERVTSEFNKIMASKYPKRGIQLLKESGILDKYIPELCVLDIGGDGVVRHKYNYEHSVDVLDNMSKVSDNLWLRWCALLHDVGKGVTRRYSKVNGWTFYNHEQESPALIKTIFERLKQPLGEELEYVMKLARLHMSPQNIANNTVTDSAVRRLCNEAGDDISDLITLCECDLTTKDSNKKQLFIDNFEKVRVMVESLKSRDFVRLFQPCISGDDIMKILGLRPGKLVGLLKGILKDAILDDLVPNEEEPLRELLIKEYDKYIKENN